MNIAYMINILIVKYLVSHSYQNLKIIHEENTISSLEDRYKYLISAFSSFIALFPANSNTTYTF